MVLNLNYKKQSLKQFLYFGLVWFVVGSVQMLVMENRWWLGLGWFTIGAIYLIVFLLRKKQGYMSISDSEIKQNRWFGKSIPIKDITKIKYFAGDFVIESSHKTIRINKDFIDEPSLTLLRERLDIIKTNL